MQIEEAKNILVEYVRLTKPIFGNVSIDISDDIDVAKFPDELSKLKDQKEGLYIIWSKNDRRVIYVGIAVDIPRRVYQHIGKGYSWSRDSSTARFPHCTLAEGRHWLNPTTQKEMQDAEWNITAVLTNPGSFRGQLESMLIFWGIQNNKKPEINVEL